jgi:lipoprotein-anchoring transpeptidase ErfK/SrfK
VSLSDPLGSASSHGCVRLANRAIAWIAERVPPGTPVLIGATSRPEAGP